MATKPTYKEQLLDPRWQKKRLEALNAADWLCSRCECKETTLHVHHTRYVKGRMVWEYELSELQVLCKDCHKEEHELRELLDTMLMEVEQVSGGAVMAAIALLAGFWDAECMLSEETSKVALRLDPHTSDLGILAAIAGGASWKKMAAAAEIVRPRTLSPVEEWALSRWKEEQ